MAQRKGLFGVDWGAVGELAGAVFTGDGEKATEVLSRKPDEPAPVDEPARGCGATTRDGMACAGHTPDGACIMVKVKPA